MSETLNFSGDICLSRMLELADDLRRAIEPETQVTLDGGRFSDVDLAGIQLLLAAQRRAVSQGATLRVLVPQEGPLRDALGRYGYDTTAGATVPLPFLEVAS